MSDLRPQRLVGRRIVARPEALDTAVWPADGLPLRLAEDDVLLLGGDGAIEIDDPDALIVRDAGHVGVWLEGTDLDLIASVVEWRLPVDRPALSQGAVAALPARLWCEDHRVLVIVVAPLGAELEERLTAAAAA